MGGKTGRKIGRRIGGKMGGKQEKTGKNGKKWK
jgi:hypothetical protein